MTPESLARANLAYREPAAYDELIGDSPIVDEVVALADRARADVRAVLDLGCGTGKVLAELHARRAWHGTGIDLQDDLLTYARQRRPGLVFLRGDLRGRRQDATYDLVLCLGNTLSYLHTDLELAAAYATIAAHSHPGTLLAVDTLTGSGSDAGGTSTVQLAGLGEVTVETASVWNAATRILISRRTWRFESGRVEHDQIHRRFWDRDTLADQARRAGFGDLTATANSRLTLCASFHGGR